MPPKGKEIFSGPAFSCRRKNGTGTKFLYRSKYSFITHETLTQEEHDEYRRPFLVPGKGVAQMLSWARQLPFEGEPSTVYRDSLKKCRMAETKPITKTIMLKLTRVLPSLMQNCSANSLPKYYQGDCEGFALSQEDSPVEVGTALSVWIQGLNLQ